MIGAPETTKCAARRLAPSQAARGFRQTSGVFEEYVNSVNTDMRTAALEGIGRIRDPQDVPTLDKTFNNEKNLQPRLAAAFALVSEGKLDTSRVQPPALFGKRIGPEQGEFHVTGLPAGTVPEGRCPEGGNQADTGCHKGGKAGSDRGSRAERRARSHGGVGAANEGP